MNDRGAPGLGRHGITVIWGWRPGHSLRPDGSSSQLFRSFPRVPADGLSSTSSMVSLGASGERQRSGSGGDRSSGYSSSAGWSQMVSGGGGRAGDSELRPPARAACFRWYPAAARRHPGGLLGAEYLPQGLVAVDVFRLGASSGNLIRWSQRSRSWPVALATRQRSGSRRPSCGLRWLPPHRRRCARAREPWVSKWYSSSS